MHRSAPKVYRRLTHGVAPLAPAVLAVSCAFGGLSVPVSDDVRRPPADVGCASWAAGQPVRGILTLEEGEGSVATRIVSDDGVLQYVKWPSGFSARRDDGGDLALVDDRGTVLFRDGETVDLPQVDVRTHAGTIDDPYVASGIIGGQCWVPPPDQFTG